MKIGIDIDDTITDSYLDCLEYIAKYYNKDYEELKNRNYTYDDFFNNSEFPNFDEFAKTLSGILENFKLKDNAKEVITRLKEEGNEIIIITARESDTKNINMEFLEKHNIPYDKLYQGAFDKGYIAQKENIDVLIDDSYKHYEQVTSRNIDALLFDAPYNRKYTNCNRVESWNEIYKILEN